MLRHFTDQKKILRFGRGVTVVFLCKESRDLLYTDMGDITAKYKVCVVNKVEYIGSIR